MTQGWYAVSDAMLGYRCRDKLSLQVNVNSLFDKVYCKKSSPAAIGHHDGDSRIDPVSLRASV